MTILLDVIAVCRAPEDPDTAPPAEPEQEPEPELPAALPTSSGVYLIHVAPSGRLDPSSKDLGKVEIADDDELVDDHLKKFLVD